MRRPVESGVIARKQTLNEEQLAQGKKEAATDFDFPIYAVSPKYQLGENVSEIRPTHKLEFVEAERFVDARSFAVRLFGVSEVHIAPALGEKNPLPRWQVRWAGNAAASNNLHMQARQLPQEYDSRFQKVQWKSVREM